MVIFRRLAPILQNIRLTQRFYARKTVTTTDADMKQIHQETLRYISPYARINVDSDIYIKVSSADPHSYPNGDAFIAELHGDPVKNCTASMVVTVSDDERNVDVVLRKLTDNTIFHCELAVPVKASLEINTRHAAHVQNTYGDELKVRAQKFITTKNVRAEKIELFSSEGDINCRGILLAKETTVEAQNKGNIMLDKLQGDDIKCKTTDGNITTNCSYVESSEFETDTGCLDLKNVHKKVAVRVHQNGDLKMTGVHGNLKISMNEGTMNLQLSELEGKNSIDAKNLTSCIINISDDIEQNASLDINLNGEKGSSSLCLDSSLKHLSLALSENGQQFKWPLDQERSNKLRVDSGSSLTLGKSSWMDTMRLQINDNTS